MSAAYTQYTVAYLTKQKKISSTCNCSAELVERFEASRVIDIVRVKGNTEEAAVGDDRLTGNVLDRAAVAGHLAVHQVHVKVGKLDVIALRSFVAAA